MKFEKKTTVTTDDEYTFFPSHEEVTDLFKNWLQMPELLPSPENVSSVVFNLKISEVVSTAEEPKDGTSPRSLAEGEDSSD